MTDTVAWAGLAARDASRLEATADDPARIREAAR